MSRGKVVDTWYWKRPDATLVKVPLLLLKTTQDRVDHSPPFETIRSVFRVEIGDPPFEIEGTDCEAIRKATWAALDKRFKIRWERYFLVTIMPESPWEGLGTGFCLSYTECERGYCWDGSELMRQYCRTGRDFKVKPWPGDFVKEGKTVKACIPATKANDKALDEFCRRINELRERLEEFLSPEKIQETLSNLGSMRLLPNSKDGG